MCGVCLWLLSLSFAFPDAEDGAGEIEVAAFRPVCEGPERASRGAHRRMGVEPVAIDDDQGEEGEGGSHGVHRRRTMRIC